MVLLYSAKTLVARNYQPLLFIFLYTYSCSIKQFGYFITFFLYLTCSVHINAIFCKYQLICVDRIYPYYPQVKRVRKLKNRTAASFGYVKRTLFPLCQLYQDIYQYLNTYLFVSVLVYEYDSSVLPNFKILQLFLCCPLQIFPSVLRLYNCFCVVHYRFSLLF